MPCCGGKNGGKPISRTQYVVGRVMFGCMRLGLGVGLATVGRFSPRFREIARFWELLSADWAESIERREGIAFLDEPDDLPIEECPLPAPPSHADATAGDAGFGLDWGDDDALFDDAATERTQPAA